jgi:hypothetical protein
MFHPGNVIHHIYAGYRIPPHFDQKGFAATFKSGISPGCLGEIRCRFFYKIAFLFNLLQLAFESCQFQVSQGAVPGKGIFTRLADFITQRRNMLGLIPGLMATCANGILDC